MFRLSRFIRFISVTVGIILLTSFTIDATDSFQKSQSALSMLTGKVLENECSSGTVEFMYGGVSLCIDEYEVSPSEDCPTSIPTSVEQSKYNIDTKACAGVSQKDVMPWTSVTILQAKEICALRGMRLPSNMEWFESALGTRDDGTCNVQDKLHVTGSKQSCVSPVGTYDMIGNVWEWIDGFVVDGVYKNRSVPPDGYVLTVDLSGVATHTTTTEQFLMNEDYFWSNALGEYVMMRGGFYGSGDDGGLYAVHAGIDASFSGPAIGFRCISTK